jgi:hypothetical protein
MEYTYYIPNVFFANLHTSLGKVFTNCRYKYTTAKLITLQFAYSIAEMRSAGRDNTTHRREDNIKMDLKKDAVGMSTRFNWLRIGISGGLL